MTPKELGYTNDPWGSNSLLEHVKALNKIEAIKHDQRREAAIERIKALRQRTRNQQETLAYKDTIRPVS